MGDHISAAFRTAWQEGRAVTFFHKGFRVTVQPSGRVQTERVA